MISTLRLHSLFSILAILCTALCAQSRKPDPPMGGAMDDFSAEVSALRTSLDEVFDRPAVVLFLTSGAPDRPSRHPEWFSEASGGAFGEALAASVRENFANGNVAIAFKTSSELTPETINALRRWAPHAGEEAIKHAQFEAKADFVIRLEIVPTATDDPDARSGSGLRMLFSIDVADTGERIPGGHRTGIAGTGDAAVKRYAAWITKKLAEGLNRKLSPFRESGLPREVRLLGTSQEDRDTLIDAIRELGEYSNLDARERRRRVIEEQTGSSGWVLRIRHSAPSADLRRDITAAGRKAGYTITGLDVSPWRLLLRTVKTRDPSTLELWEKIYDRDLLVTQSQEIENLYRRVGFPRIGVLVNMEAPERDRTTRTADDPAEGKEEKESDPKDRSFSLDVTGLADLTTRPRATPIDPSERRILSGQISNDIIEVLRAARLRNIVDPVTVRDGIQKKMERASNILGESELRNLLTLQDGYDILIHGIGSAHMRGDQMSYSYALQAIRQSDGIVIATANWGDGDLHPDGREQIHRNEVGRYLGARLVSGMADSWESPFLFRIELIDAKDQEDAHTVVGFLRNQQFFPSIISASVGNFLPGRNTGIAFIDVQSKTSVDTVVDAIRMHKGKLPFELSAEETDRSKISVRLKQ